MFHLVKRLTFRSTGTVASNKIFFRIWQYLVFHLTIEMYHFQICFQILNRETDKSKENCQLIFNLKVVKSTFYTGILGPVPTPPSTQSYSHP